MKHERSLAAVAVAAAVLLGLAIAPPAPPEAAAQTVCFKKGEYVSGMNKICIYDCMGSEAAITVSSVSLCPLSIRR